MRKESVRKIPLSILITAILGAIFIVDLRIWPQRNLTILYAIPVFFAALRLPPAKVSLVTVVAVTFDLLDLLMGSAIHRSWPVTVLALAVVCSFAILQSTQRSAIARRTQEAIDARAQVAIARHGLQRFLGMVAHDLRAPLTVLTGCVEILQDSSKEVTPAARRKAVQGIARTTQRIERLSTDLLDAARIGAGRFEIRLIPMDLVEVVREVVELQQATTTAHRLVLRAPERLDGQWDRERIIQVFTNLISNAIKYSDGGEVRITVQRSADKAVGCVTDEGIGIPPEKISRLFDPFMRLEQEPGRNGTGLGLFIAQGIVEAHGGRIWVDSVHGKGTTFCVELPLAGVDQV
jgi:signal transduction histidine kinase